MKSRADLFGIPNYKWLNNECTNPDLSTNDEADNMTIFNCGFKFQNVSQLKMSSNMSSVWPDNLVQQ